MPVDPPPADRLCLRVAGLPVLTRGGAPLNPGTRKALALVVLLALEPQLRRQCAADLLWPEADPVSARRNLRRDLFRLRSLDLPLQDAGAETLALPAIALEWPAPGALPPRWLDGLDEVAAIEFAQWVEAQRLPLQRRWIDALVAGAREAEAAGDADTALQRWQGVLADGAAGPGHVDARQALQRLQPAPPPDAATAAAPGASAAPRLQVPLVGRVHELAAIHQALDNGWAMLVDGAPGIGKTRLVLEALALRGGALLAACRPEDAAVPYASALRALLTLRDAAPDVPLPAWVRRDLAVLLPDWAPGRTTGNEPPAPDRLQRAFRAAVARLVDGNFGAVVVDDWQWADAASVALWATPQDVGAPLVVAHRSGALPATQLQQRRTWLDTGQAQAVHLEPLPPDDAARVVQAVAPGVGTAAVQMAVERAGGNPLFAIEWARHLHRAPPTATPAGVRDVILARVRALGPTARAVLEAAAVAGDAASPGLLASVAGCDELAAAAVLDHAAAADLMAPDGEGRSRYVHDLLAQAVCDDLAPMRRAALHGRWAQALAAAQAAPGRVARHLVAAGRAADAAPWLLQAAQQALQRGAASDALTACDAVLAADGPLPGERCSAQRLRAQALRRLADPAAAEAALDAAMADAARAGPAAVIELALDRAALWAHTGRADEALAELDRLDGDTALTQALRQRVLRERANALSYRGRHAQSMPALQALLDALPPSAPRERLNLLELLARNAYWAGDLARARALTHEHLELAHRLDDDESSCKALFRLGALARERGEQEDAERQLAGAMALARAGGYVELLRSAIATQVTIHLNAMRLAEAQALLAEGEQAAPHWDTPDLEDVFADRRLRLAWLCGDAAAAWRLVHASLQRHGCGGHQHLRLATLARGIDMALTGGDVAQARTMLDEALALHAAAGAASLVGDELAIWEVAVRLAEGDAAWALARARQLFKAGPPPRVEDRAVLLLAAGEAALQAGEIAAARGWLADLQSLQHLQEDAVAGGHALALRVAAACGRGLPAACAAARAWLARPALPVPHAARLARVLAEVQPARAAAPATSAATRRLASG